MSLTITIKPKSQKRVLVEMDADKFERFAANLGFFSSDFLRSIEIAEADYRAGRIKKISSLRQLKK